jgi:hypothetical protein
MKELKAYFFIITIVLLFSAKLTYAKEQASVTPATAAPAIATPTAAIQPVEGTNSFPITDITNDPIYTELIAKKNIKDGLTTEENQVCRDIRDQEILNSEQALKIIEKSKSYSTPYRKIIDDIKSLLNPVKIQKTLDSMELAKNINAADTTDTLNNKLELYTNQIASLNLAIKGMRESIKFISLESAAFNQKTGVVQQKINDINMSIANLNNRIIEDKLSKEIEWENFCLAMSSKDLKTANTSYGNMVAGKERIVKNYKEILSLKKKIYEQLVSV